MLDRLLENLRTKSAREKNIITLVVLILVGLFLVPAWSWNMKNLGFYQSETTTTSSLDLSALENAPNPLSEIGSSLKDVLSSPVTVSKAQVVDSDLQISFKIYNPSLTDLIFPTQSAALNRGTEVLSSVKRTAKNDRTEFPSIIPAGQTLEGVMYFPKVNNGSYSLKISGLYYQENNQSAFDQLINFEVSNVLLPRQ